MSEENYQSHRRQFLKRAGGAAMGAAALGAITERSTQAKSQQTPPSGQVTSVMDYGAKGDGKTDDTQSLLKAIAAAEHTTQVVYFPPGHYLVSRTITLATTLTLQGAGCVCTKITTNQPTGDVLVATAWGVQIRDLGFTAAVKRTGGIYVNFTASAGFGYIGHFFMEGAFIGIDMAGVCCRVEKGSIRDGASGPGSAGIICTGGDDLHISNVTMDNPGDARPDAGIWVKVTGAVQMTDCDIIRSGKCLYLTEANSVYCVNTFFDTADYGIYIEPTVRALFCHFIGCWTCGHQQDGVRINTPSAEHPHADLSDLDFIGHESMYNKGDGFAIEGHSIQVANSVSALNGGAGLRVGATATRCRILGNMIGNTGHMDGNADGIVLTEGCSGNLITDNIVTGNAKTQISGPTAKNAVHSNMGIDI